MSAYFRDHVNYDIVKTSAILYKTSDNVFCS